MRWKLMTLLNWEIMSDCWHWKFWTWKISPEMILHNSCKFLSFCSVKFQATFIYKRSLVYVNCCFSPVPCIFIASDIVFTKNVFKQVSKLKPKVSLYEWSRLHACGISPRQTIFFYKTQTCKFYLNDHINVILLKRPVLVRLIKLLIWPAPKGVGLAK